MVRFKNLELTMRAILALEHCGIQFPPFLIANIYGTLGIVRKLEMGTS